MAEVTELCLHQGCKTWRKQGPEEGANRLQVALNHCSNHWAECLVHCGEEQCNGQRHIRTEKKSPTARAPEASVVSAGELGKGTLPYQVKTRHSWYPGFMHLPP